MLLMAFVVTVNVRARGRRTYMRIKPRDWLERSDVIGGLA